MTDPFHAHIQTSLANPVLQDALDANADRRINIRIQAFSSVPDYPRLRKRAHAVRADVVANLDSYLEEFISRVTANGVVVHRAADAAEANRIVIEIARQNNAKLVAKSKTMVSEEIELNHALEQAGIQAVETDLGEYIVQLRGERPAHIITPAVHLRRKEVGETFHEKLGIPLTQDIPTMTDEARRRLRQVFLQADIGLSGVNFGVVETGALCLVTNEGNGRMVTTIPPVHIALMGIERLVPTLDDLALMLALLPRSATGQKITVYSSLIHSPRRPGDPDGPRERHLVLVDNGRRAVRAGPLAESLLCIRCGACLNACPVFREIGGHAYVGAHGEASAYPGPIGSVVSPALFGGSDFGHLARASSLCGACKEACPVDIDLPKLLLRVRAGHVSAAEADVPVEHQPEPAPLAVPWFLKIGLVLYAWIASNPRRFSMAQRLGGFFGRLAAPHRPWIRLPAFTGWGYSKDFPRPAARPFRDQFRPSQASVAPFEAGSSHSHTTPDVKAPGMESDSLESLVATFTDELTVLGGRVFTCEPGEIADALLTWLRERQVNSILAWEEDQLPDGLLEKLAANGVEVGPLTATSTRVGLTGALAGIAETGTLIVHSGKGRPLGVSLLPEIHVAVLRREDIYASLSGYFSESGSGKPEKLRSLSALALISGPSRTADIEMTLTIGVHGPKEVHVFIV